jgi:hypothetical protein
MKKKNIFITSTPVAHTIKIFMGVIALVFTMAFNFYLSPTIAGKAGAHQSGAHTGTTL